MVIGTVAELGTPTEVLAACSVAGDMGPGVGAGAPQPASDMVIGTIAELGTPTEVPPPAPSLAT